MQYLLTESEYRDFILRAEKQRIAVTQELQAFCTRVADELPIDGWHTHGKGKQPWGCIITHAQRRQEWYCDDCPAQEQCPYTAKEWSK